MREFKARETSILHESRVEVEEGESEAKATAFPLPTDARSDNGKESGVQNKESLLNHIQVCDGGHKGDGK